MKAVFCKLWNKYEGRVVLALGLFFVAIIAFEAGVLRGQDWQKSPLIVEKPAEMIDSVKTAENCLKAQNLPAESVQNGLVAGKTTENDPSSEISCAFIGSKNSDKYHLPSCSWATRIKPENRVCFKNAEDAKSKGYVPASCMKK